MMNEREKNPFLHLKDHHRYEFVKEVEVMPPAHVPLASCTCAADIGHCFTQACGSKSAQQASKQTLKQIYIYIYVYICSQAARQEGACRRTCTETKPRLLTAILNRDFLLLGPLAGVLP